jgi:hypothetical protein
VLAQETIPPRVSPRQAAAAAEALATMAACGLPAPEKRQPARGTAEFALAAR